MNHLEKYWMNALVNIPTVMIDRRTCEEIYEWQKEGRFIEREGLQEWEWDFWKRRKATIFGLLYLW